jgi:hypothetical protein
MNYINITIKLTLIAHLFSVLCSPIMCLCALGSVLWFPHAHDGCFVFTSSCLYGIHVFLTLCVCVFAHSGVQHIPVLCCGFLFLFVLCCVYPDVYLTVLWIFHPSQTGSTIQFEKHASQKQVVFFTTIPPTLRIITACTCKVPFTGTRSYYTLQGSQVDM